MKKITKKKVKQLIKDTGKWKDYTKQSIDQIVSAIIDEYVYDKNGVYKTQISKFGATTYKDYCRPLKMDKKGRYTMATSSTGSEWRIILRVTIKDLK